MDTQAGIAISPLARPTAVARRRPRLGALWTCLLLVILAFLVVYPVCMLLLGALTGGDPVVECAAFMHDRDRVWRVAVAAEPVSSGDLFLRHKTTHREIYNRARTARPDGDDVFAWVAAESAAVRAVRAHLREHWGLRRGQHHAIGYWRRGRAMSGTD